MIKIIIFILNFQITYGKEVSYNIDSLIKAVQSGDYKEVKKLIDSGYSDKEAYGKILEKYFNDSSFVLNKIEPIIYILDFHTKQELFLSSGYCKLMLDQSVQKLSKIDTLFFVYYEKICKVKTLLEIVEVKDGEEIYTDVEQHYIDIFEFFKLATTEYQQRLTFLESLNSKNLIPGCSNTTFKLKDYYALMTCNRLLNNAVSQAKKANMDITSLQTLPGKVLQIQ